MILSLYNYLKSFIAKRALSIFVHFRYFRLELRDALHLLTAISPLNSSQAHIFTMTAFCVRNILFLHVSVFQWHDYESFIISSFLSSVYIYHDLLLRCAMRVTSIRCLLVCPLLTFMYQLCTNTLVLFSVIMIECLG